MIVSALTGPLADFRAARRRRPLAAWTAWHQAPPATSQRELCQLLERYKTVLALGGNRSGKTEWLRAIVVAMALGSDHPDARAFWLRNGCDPDSFPKGPGKAAIFARRSNDSINYHRRQIDRLLPTGGRDPNVVKWWNKNGRGEARVEIRCPGYETPAEIVFKSEDQGEDAAQGDNWRISAHDEEGDTPNVWDECSVRLWDQRGWQIMANTPVKGRTWIYYRFVAPEKPREDVAVRWIHSLDNPFLPPEEARKLEENEVLAAARLRGEFVVLKGRVWPMFNRQTHVVEPFPIPADWPRFRAIDFGTRNPFCCVWAAMSQGGPGHPPEGVVVVYRQHYQAGWTLSQHVRAIRIAEGWEWVADELVPGSDAEAIDMTWADPEDPQQLASLNLDHDMGATPAYRSVSEGIDKVAQKMALGGDGWPGIVVFDSCGDVIREIEGYVWRDPVAGKQPEKPLKKDDHAADTVRYLVTGLERW